MKYTTWAIFVAFALAAFCTGASARSSTEDAADSGDDDWCESQAYCESSRAHYNKINHCQYLLYSCLYTVGNDTDDVEGRKRSTEDETDGLTYTCGCTPDESTSEGERRRRRSTEDTTGDVTWTDCSCLCACFNMYFNCYYQICDNMTWAVRSIPSDLVSDYSDTDCTTNTDTSTNNKTATSDSNGGVVVDSDSTPGGTGSTPGGADSTSGGTGGGDSTPGGGDSTTGGDSNSGLFPVASDSTNGGDSTTGGGSSPGGDSTTTGGSNSGAFPVASDSTNGGSTTGGGSSPGGDSTTGGSTGGGAGSSGAGGNTAVSSSIVSPNNYYSSSGTSTTTKNTTRCYFQMYGDPHMVRFAEVSRANDQWLCMSDTTYPKLYHSDSLQVSAHATIPFVGSSVSYLRSVSFTISGTTYTVNTTNFAITPSKAPSGHYFGTCNSSVTTPLGSFSYPCVAMYAPTGDWVAVFYIADTGVGNYLDLEIYGDCETTSVSSLQSVECPGSKKRSIDEALRSVVVTAEAEAACATVTGNYKSACKYDYAMTGGLVSSSSAAVANSGMVRVASLYAAYVAVQQNTTSSSSSSKISQGAAAGIAIGTGVAGIIIGAAIIGGVAIKRKRNN